MNIQSNTSATSLEVADIFRDHGPAWRAANAGHVSLDQMKVMSAIERCRTAALGGHVARCPARRLWRIRGRDLADGKYLTRRSGRVCRTRR